MKVLKFQTQFSFVFILLTLIFSSSCTNKIEPSSITSASSSLPELTPAAPENGGKSKGWGPLESICKNQNITNVEELICDLDDLLEEIEDSGKQMTDYINEFSVWVERSMEVRKQVCQNTVDITFLTVGTLQVLAARNLIILPINLASVLGSNSVHPVVRKIIESVVSTSISIGCNIDLAELGKIVVFPPRGSSNSGTSSGGSVNAGNSGTDSCKTLQDRFQMVCKPHCVDKGTCEGNKCSQITTQCQQEKCNCQ